MPHKTGKKLVLVGGGHAHMQTLAAIGNFVRRGHSVTVVAPSPYHYYSGMGPGMLGGTYQPEDIRFATQQQVEKLGGTFVLGRVTRIDPVAGEVELADGGRIPYDVVSCNAGSQVPTSLPITAAEGEGVPIFTVKPIERLWEARQQLLALAIEGPPKVAVIGGGPSAVEIAGNTWRLLREAGHQRPCIRIFAGRKLMGRASEEVRRRVNASLARRHIEVVEPGRVQEIHDGRVVIEGRNNNCKADFIFLAQGIRPAPIFADSGLPVGPDGGLLVNEYLHCPGKSQIFGGGDCIYFEPQPLDKVGVYAVRQNPVLRHNLLAALEGGELRTFAPGGDYLLIYNLGDDTGVLQKRWLIFGGRLAFRIKDYIDRRFMRRFQQHA
ncbi:NAD(P)/FAD-dependent oxidoreductase [Desulfurivibrio dismutans]|uniref:NAD(P)/FAD-dependent oxidoreductase n=1 Tax=Desulfurivibrio dismutans TaxID=1398908 RepID=UPI0023DBFC0C|nr:FAD-dependent oxidoreductase [Desulfurivibrio alkaliphilus]MDF1615775.1 FAD-dependent oxidoreductase [Desulfurivibrio alkaliphilus]